MSLAKKLPRVTVYLGEWQAKLAAHSKETGIPQAAIIRKALELYFNSPPVIIDKGKKGA
jgi:ribbon-helix-helix protein